MLAVVGTIPFLSLQHLIDPNLVLPGDVVTAVTLPDPEYARRGLKFPYIDKAVIAVSPLGAPWPTESILEHIVHHNYPIPNLISDSQTFYPPAVAGLPKTSLRRILFGNIIDGPDGETFAKALTEAHETVRLPTVDKGADISISSNKVFVLESQWGSKRTPQPSIETLRAMSFRNLMHAFSICPPPDWPLWFGVSFAPGLKAVAAGQVFERTQFLDQEISSTTTKTARWAASAALQQATLLEVTATRNRCQVYMDALPRDATAEQQAEARQKREDLAKRIARFVNFDIVLAPGTPSALKDFFSIQAKRDPDATIQQVFDGASQTNSPYYDERVRTYIANALPSHKLVVEVPVMETLTNFQQSGRSPFPLENADEFSPNGPGAIALTYTTIPREKPSPDALVSLAIPSGATRILYHTPLPAASDVSPRQAYSQAPYRAYAKDNTQNQALNPLAMNRSPV